MPYGILAVSFVVVLLSLAWHDMNKRGEPRPAEVRGAAVGKRTRGATLSVRMANRDLSKDGNAQYELCEATYHKINPYAEPSLLVSTRQRFVALHISAPMGQHEPMEINAIRYEHGVQTERFLSRALLDEQADHELPCIPELPQISPGLIAFLGDDLLAMYKAPVTARLLINACNQAGIARHFRCFDTLSMARALYPNISDYNLRNVMALMGRKQESEAQGIAAILNEYAARNSGSATFLL